MLVLAHRGANRLALENTVAAMAAAVDLGADGVELDVHRTADGVLVVRHDAQTADGPIGELTLSALQSVQPEVPVLAAVLDVCRGRLVNVEVKDSDPRAAEALVALLAGRSAGAHEDVVDEVLVSSFDVATVDRVRAAAPHLPTGFLSFGLPPDDALAIAIDHGHTAVHPDVWTLLQVDVPEFVTRAHDLGLQVNVWTVNDPLQVEQLRDAGVDAVITDDEQLYAFGDRRGDVRGRPR